MAEQERMNEGSTSNLRDSDDVGQSKTYQPADYLEETSAEFAYPMTNHRMMQRDRSEIRSNGKGIGMVALIVSILSLFVSPILFGVVGIVLGFIARRRGSESLGSWAIGIGALSIIIGMFILPFF